MYNADKIRKKVTLYKNIKNNTITYKKPTKINHEETIIIKSWFTMSIDDFMKTAKEEKENNNER